MNSWTIFYILFSVNISIISFIPKGEATDNSETEILEGSSSKMKQLPHEETGTASTNILHRSHTEEDQLEYHTESEVMRTNSSRIEAKRSSSRIKATGEQSQYEKVGTSPNVLHHSHTGEHQLEYHTESEVMRTNSSRIKAKRSSSRSKTKQKQPHYEEIGTSSDNVLYQSQTEEQHHIESQNYVTENFYTREDIAGITENYIIREGHSNTEEATFSGRGSLEIADDEEARDSTIKFLFEETSLHHIPTSTDNGGENLWNHFLKYRSTNPEEVFRKYTDDEKLKLCLRAWVMYLLGGYRILKEAVTACEKKREVENIKRGPVFRENFKLGKHKTIEKVAMIGCKVIDKIISSKSYVFIIPSELSNSYYVASGTKGKNKKIKKIQLHEFIENVKLQEERDTSFKRIFKTICCSSKDSQND